MEDVTDVAFRLLCKRFGADMVYTEFLSADALIRQVAGTTRKLEIDPEERPVAIQIYGREVEPMVEAARIAEAAGPEVLDLNFGCPVKRVAGKGAGSGMLRCPDQMLRIVEEIVKAVKIPVIAAGGIADGRGVAAAFALGAEGVQLGTRFICCTECTVHPNFKQAVLDARDRSTSVTGQRTGHPVRCLRNKLTAEFDKLDARLAPLEEIEKLGTGRLRSAVVDGDTDWGSLMSGQSAAMVNDILPARRIVERLFGEARDVLQKIQGCCDVDPE